MSQLEEEEVESKHRIETELFFDIVIRDFD